MTTATVTKTLAAALCRTFGSLDRDEATTLFNSVLDAPREEKDDSEAKQVVRAAVETCFDRALTTLADGTTKGGLLSREQLTMSVRELVGSAVAGDALKGLLAAVLAGPEYVGKRGRYQGGTRRVSDPYTPPPAKAAPKKRQPKATETLSAVVEVEASEDGPGEDDEQESDDDSPLED